VNIPCKIGTIPMVIFARDKRTPLEVGRTVRIKREAGGRWEKVRVTRVDASGYFMADCF
jgi:hypothetical protein